MHNPAQNLSRAGRDAGIAQVIVNETPRQGIEEGLTALQEFLSFQDDCEFIFEEFRIWAISVGALKKTHHPNWWGALCMTARRKGLITKTGKYRAMQSMSSHARETPVYVAA